MAEVGSVLWVHLAPTSVQAQTPEQGAQDCVHVAIEDQDHRRFPKRRPQPLWAA